MRHRNEERNNQRGMDRSNERSSNRSQRQPNYGNPERFTDINRPSWSDGDREMYSRGQVGRSQSREDEYESHFGDRDHFSRDYSPGQFGEQNYTDFERGYGEDRAWNQREQRPSNTGPHMGKGPKGYTRSDERIREEVCETLSRHGEIDASHIEVEVENGEVTLTGTVDERRTKRLIEECVEELSGVREVNNRIRLSRDESSSHQFQQKEGGSSKRGEGFKGRVA